MNIPNLETLQDSFSTNNIIKEQSTPVITVTNDTTPRISYWYGKINQHNKGGTWMTDPDGISGAAIDKLSYCKKWWPETISYKEYKLEKITSWRDRGNIGGPYTSTKMSYECIINPSY